MFILVIHNTIYVIKAAELLQEYGRPHVKLYGGLLLINSNLSDIELVSRIDMPSMRSMC